MLEPAAYKISRIGLSFAGCLILFALHSASAAEKAQPTAKGKELALEFCQACHYFEGTDQAGTVGPALVAIKARFPDRTKLYEIVYDAHAAIGPDTMMPPFGRNELMTKQEIETLIDFLQTL